MVEDCGSVVMLTVANCILMIDVKKAFTEYVNLLMLGGTLAVWEYLPKAKARKGAKMSPTRYGRKLSNCPRQSTARHRSRAISQQHPGWTKSPSLLTLGKTCRVSNVLTTSL